MSKVHTRGPAPLRANLTPMIDVTFLLIVFFVLVSQIVEVENVDLDLPRPVEPMTMAPGEDARAVINVVPTGGGRAKGYRLAGRTFPAGAAGVTELTDRLGELFAANPAISVNLRADRGTHFEWVEPIIQAVADAASRAEPAGGRARVNLVVQRER